jgi:hypothetical protein
MRRKTIFVMAVFMVLSAKITQASVSTVVNGSFEYDGPINNILTKEPNGWDVNIPSGQFGGWVLNDWPTDGFYNLTIASNWYTGFDVNDIAIVSQDVSFKDVKRIIFDLMLDTSGSAWNPDKRTVVIMVDDVIIWQCSDTSEPTDNRIIDVNFNDGKIHRLSLGLMSKAKENWWNVDTIYYAYWDYIAFDCRGLGVFEGDFNRDCVVDFNDYAMMANLWLEDVEPDSKYNLYTYGVINFRDYAVLADIRDSNDLSDVESFTSIWLDEVETNNQWNLYKGDDDRVVNLSDLAVFVEDWLKGSYD